MSSFLDSTRALMQTCNGRLQEFTREIDNEQMVWLEEIKQEAYRMFSSDFSTEPELMPRTPSQKKSRRRKRVSTELNASGSERRFSSGKSTNLRCPTVQSTLEQIPELQSVADPQPEESQRRTRRNNAGRPAAAESKPVKRNTRKKPADTSSAAADPLDEEAREEAMWIAWPGHGDNGTPPPGRTSGSMRRLSRRGSLVLRNSLAGLRCCVTQGSVPRGSRRSSLKKKAVLSTSMSSGTLRDECQMDMDGEQVEGAMALEVVEEPAELEHAAATDLEPSQPEHKPVVMEEQKEEEEAEPQPSAVANHRITRSTTRSTATNPAPASYIDKMNTPTAGPVDSAKKLPVRTGLREVEEPAEPEHVAATHPEPAQPEHKPVVMEEQQKEEEAEPQPSAVANHRITRSTTRSTPTNPAPASYIDKMNTPTAGPVDSAKKLPVRTELGSGSKRPTDTAPEELCSPRKGPSSPKRSQKTIQPNMRAFQRTVQKNQLLMTTPGKSVIRSFIKTTTAAKADPKELERQRLEAQRKKMEQEEERMKRIEEERRRRQEDIKRKRDERLKRLVEVRQKEEQKELERKKKVEQKIAQIEVKMDKRLLEEKAKKVASKRQEELELRRKQEEEARRRRIQQAEDEERRHQEALARRRAEEEQERKQAELRRVLELKQQQERQMERERERFRERQRQAAAERERVEREKAIALQRELEEAAREKERREQEERKRREEEEAQRKAKEVQSLVMKNQTGKGLLNATVDVDPALNATFDVQQSPESYQMTPKGKKPRVLVDPEDYGMDQNSDDSTDDESAPRKPVPSWAQGLQLQQAVKEHYYNPQDLHTYWGPVEPPNLEQIFHKSKPRFFKRTSSAVWHSPPH